MNRTDQFVITINREVGSGGRTIGRKLAEQLGVNFYDKALVKALQEKYQLDVEEIEKLKGRKHGWLEDAKRVMSIAPGTMGMQYYQTSVTVKPDLLTTDEMFKAEQEILESIAENESCVIAGRCGFYVFRNHPNHLSILIQAPMAYRLQRVHLKQGLSLEEAEKVIKKIDQMRENYVKNYTKTSRYDTRNYDMVINMNWLTEDQAVQMILDYIGK